MPVGIGRPACGNRCRIVPGDILEQLRSVCPEANAWQSNVRDMFKNGATAFDPCGVVDEQSAEV